MSLQSRLGKLERSCSADNLDLSKLTEDELKAQIFKSVEQLGIDSEKPANQITAKERKQLRRFLKDFQLEVSGHRSINEAIVTAGGVALNEIDPRTMQSKIVSGLYIAGELLDVDGNTSSRNTLDQVTIP